MPKPTANEHAQRHNVVAVSFALAAHHPSGTNVERVTLPVLRRTCGPVLHTAPCNLAT